MELAVAIQVNILGILILTMILLNYRKLDRNDLIGTLFIFLVIVSLVTQLLDISFYFSDGKQEWYFKVLSHLSTIVMYTFTFFLPIFWLVVIIYEANKDKQLIAKIFRYIIPIYFIIFIMIVTSPFTDLMYVIDENNVYSRNNMLIYSTIFSFVGIIITFGILHKNRNFLSKKQNLTFSLFILPAILGATFQFFYPSYLFLWVGISISSLIFFLYIHSSSVDVDFITGLSNENTFMNKINDLLEEKKIFTLVTYELKDISYKDTKTLQIFTSAVVNITPVSILISRNSYNTFSVITNSIDINFLKKALNSLDILLKEKEFNSEFTVTSIISTEKHKNYKSLMKDMKM